jgi:hypothetical protein
LMRPSRAASSEQAGVGLIPAIFGNRICLSVSKSDASCACGGDPARPVRRCGEILVK